MMNESRNDRRKALDNAVREYVQHGIKSGDFDDTSVISGWIIGISTAGYEGGKDIDGHIVESSPGVNNFMAAGLALATSTAFESQMYGDVD